jgi:glycosyltransferase involved in cell wall biosynthesis
MKLSIVIPAYNEEASIEEIVQRVQRAEIRGVEREIVVVDDGSKDRTAEIAGRLEGVRFIRRQRNGGKGAAVKTGIGAASGDIVLIQDADLEYDPGDHEAVIRPILERRCQAVMGSRFLLERPTFIGKRRSPYFTHYIGNLMIVAFTNLLYGKSFTDYEGCYKAFLRADLVATSISANGFEFDNELVCKLFRKGVRFEEVPIRYSPRTYARGKKITWRHGVIMLWTILKWRVAPLASVAPRRAAGNGRRA